MDETPILKQTKKLIITKNSWSSSIGSEIVELQSRYYQRLNDQSPSQIAPEHDTNPDYE